jgi:hypothetical protein
MRLFVSALIVTMCGIALRGQQPASDAPVWLSLPPEVREGLPSWLQLHGEYRARAEGQDGLSSEKQMVAGFSAGLVKDFRANVGFTGFLQSGDFH